jgi:hypothetical protein
MHFLDMVLIPGIITSLVVYTQFEQKTAITSFFDALSGLLILSERLFLGCCLSAIVLTLHSFLHKKSI